MMHYADTVLLRNKLTETRPERVQIRVPYAFHSRSIRVPFAFHLRSICVPFAFHLRSSCVPLYCNASALIKNAFLGNGRTRSGYTRHNIGARRKLSRLPTVARYSEVLPSRKSRKIKISCPLDL